MGSLFHINHALLKAIPVWFFGKRSTGRKAFITPGFCGIAISWCWDKPVIVAFWSGGLVSSGGLDDFTPRGDDEVGVGFFAGGSDFDFAGELKAKTWLEFALQVGSDFAPSRQAEIGSLLAVPMRLLAKGECDAVGFFEYLSDGAFERSGSHVDPPEFGLPRFATSEA